MESSRQGGLLLRRAPLRMEDPREKPRREQQHRGGSSSNQTTFLSRDVPPKQLRHIGVHCVITHSTNSFIEPIHSSLNLELCSLVLARIVGDQ